MDAVNESARMALHAIALGMIVCVCGLLLFLQWRAHEWLSRWFDRRFRDR